MEAIYISPSLWHPFPFLTPSSFSPASFSIPSSHSDRPSCVGSVFCLISLSDCFSSFKASSISLLCKILAQGALPMPSTGTLQVPPLHWFTHVRPTSPLGGGGVRKPPPKMRCWPVCPNIFTNLFLTSDLSYWVFKAWDLIPPSFGGFLSPYGNKHQNPG